MKISKMIVATTLTATLFALGACSNSDEPNVVDLTKPIDLRVESAVVMTRSLISEGATTFETGDKIGIYLAAPGEGGTPTGLTSVTYQNKEYTLGTGGWTGSPIYWQSATQKHTLYAYYPFAGIDGTAADDGKLLISIAEDQNANAGADYKAADFMWQQTVVSPTNNAVALTLNHCMSLIKVSMTHGDGFTNLKEVAGLTPAILGTIYKEGTWNLADGTIAANNAGDAHSKITPYVDDESAEGTNPSLTYYAIVMPGSVFSDGSNFVSLTATDGTLYVYKLALTSGGNLVTEAGKYYQFELTAHKGEITLSSFTIGAWKEGKEDKGDADMMVPTT